jgi:2-polyprenyl-6-methoxyphenol hydroxylase-like FAD-dependent oxidoreductase
VTSIGIVGTGISGLQLALTLQQAGIDTTVYAEYSPDEMRRTRLPNMVMRFSPTVGRERELGVEHWAQSGSRIEAISASILGTPIAFAGRLEQEGSAVDFRVYLSRLLEDYADRGGHVVTGRRSPDDIVAGAGAHDLTVIASGRESINAFFPRVPERSPYSAPQRLLCAALCHGITPRPASVIMWNAPGTGEGFLYPFFSTQGLVSVIGFEAIPGGPLEPINRVRYDDDPAAFERLALDLLEQYAPTVYERIDRSEFEITGPLDMMQGAVTPTVRRPYCEVAPGRFVVAVGDAYVANDPICGQGANLGSTTAAVLAQAICRDVAYDEWFCRGLERKLWAVAEPVTNFNNSFLVPPQPHVEMVLGAATQHQPIADAFCNNFANPAAMWQAIATPDRAAAFLASAVAAPAMAGVS